MKLNRQELESLIDIIHYLRKESFEDNFTDALDRDILLSLYTKGLISEKGHAIVSIIEELQNAISVK